MSRDHYTDAELVTNALNNIDDTLERMLLVLERIAVALEDKPRKAVLAAIANAKKNGSSLVTLDGERFLVRSVFDPKGEYNP